MSAKLRVQTGLKLPEVFLQRFPRPLVILLFLQAEVIAMATEEEGVAPGDLNPAAGSGLETHLRQPAR